MEELKRPVALDDLDAGRLLDLDVREDLRAGNDPFKRIMHAKSALAANGVLRVRAIFEPKPLYRVLGAEGFSHWTEQLAEDDWRIWFFRDGSARREAAPERRLPNCGTPRPDPADVTVVDVRGLEPPEPLERTLAALEVLAAGHTLVHINVRVPQMLLPLLEERGFSYTLREEDGVVRLFIRHATDAQVLDVRILPPREKHPRIFETFDALEPGASFVLLNDHDPVPLRYQFDAERPGCFTWAYLEQGPEIWRVEIGRTG